MSKEYPPDIVEIVQRAGHTWTFKEREKLARWLMSEPERQHLIACCLNQIHLIAPGAGLQDAEHAFSDYFGDGWLSFVRTFEPAKKDFYSYLEFCLTRYSTDVALRIRKKLSREVVELDSPPQDEEGEVYEWNFIDQAGYGKPEEESMRREFWRALGECLSALRPVYSRVFLLSYENDLSGPEISKILKITEGNVRARLHRARRELAKCLKQKDFDLWREK